MGWAFLSNRLPAGQTDEGRDAVSFLSVGAAACPDALEFHTQKQGSERLPLEGKLAQRQLRLMRSKLPIITIGWYDTVTFDLIRHAKRRDTFPSRGRLFSVPAVPTSIYTAQMPQDSASGHASPLQCHAGRFRRPYRAMRGICAFPQKITIGHGKNPVADGFKKKEVNYETP